MTKTNNPWLDMPESSQRRIDSSTAHDLYWITDLEGKYGFCLKSKNKFSDLTKPALLKGISILKRNSAIGKGELYLVLNDKEDWQIFYALCKDIISVTHKYNTDEAMISVAEVRLKRWQQLLQQDRDREMRLERQMGLFSELLCFRDIVLPQFGIAQSIVSWVGPDFDKQDFLLDDCIIEVKSYKTSKGQVVHISSIKQLVSEKIPLYLLSYGLTVSENGISIKDIADEINALLEDESNELKIIFEKKLLEYGYMPELIKTTLHNFIVDKRRLFQVSDDFPKVSPHAIKSEIINVKYSIDLFLCDDYEVGIETLFDNEK